jgi:hypothetical protein
MSRRRSPACGVVLSGFNDDELKVRAVTLGYASYLVKPVAAMACERLSRTRFRIGSHHLSRLPRLRRPVRISRFDGAVPHEATAQFLSSVGVAVEPGVARRPVTRSIWMR